MSDLVKKYLDASMKRGDPKITDEEDKKLVDEMAGLKKKFGEKDWDELLSQVPKYMKPMVMDQKQKHLK